jgi:glucose/arabinose dehydrogenase
MKAKTTLAAALAAMLSTAAFAQSPPDLGIAAVKLRDTPYTFDTAEQHGIKVSTVVHGLAHPFSVAFLANGDALVTERGAGLRLVRGATGSKATLEPQALAGIPAQQPSRGAGINDVQLHPKFADNRWVYFTYNKTGDLIPDSTPPRRQSAVAVGRAKFDGKALANVEEIFVGNWSPNALGSRLAFGHDGNLYMTTGAAFDDAAQRLDTVYGKVLRLTEDGKPAKDNPVATRAGARAEIFTYGHRDQLGLTVEPKSGTVLAVEHGPNGGDELNVILPGRNYGWPKSSYGRNYDGARMSALPIEPGIEQPLVLWLPSIAPTGVMFYTGDKLPAWKGNLFVGSARVGEIPRTGALERVVFNDKLEELRRERLLTDLHQRIRDVRQGPDGLIYVVTDEDDGALLRIEPSAL